MGIQIRRFDEERPDGWISLFQPEMVCDHCKRKIQALEDGALVWYIDMNDISVVGPVYYLHTECAGPHELATCPKDTIGRTEQPMEEFFVTGR